jgi:predicted tellurium resistance membrane protein TerC
VTFLSDPNLWASFLTLTVLEIVLGIDNLIFISIVAGKLPPHLQGRARTVGLALALITRLLLLASIAWLVGLTQTVFTLLGQGFSWRDLIMIAGGAFLIYKGTVEIHEQIEGGHGGEAPDGAASAGRKTPGFAQTIVQIMILDIVFSLDSVITAVGMADNIWIMSAAVIVAVVIMLFASGAVAAFVQAHPTVKMLALAFLFMIGMVLVADGFEVHVPKGFVYTAMAFSVAVECLNLVARRRRQRDADGTHPPRP